MILAVPFAVRVPNRPVPSGAGRTYVCVDFDALGLTSSGVGVCEVARPAVPAEPSLNLSVSQTSSSL